MSSTHKKDAVIRARINSKIKEEASAVLASIGLTPSAAYSLLMTRIATEKALPFELLVPNASAIEAMKAERRGEVIPVASAKDLVADLDDDFSNPRVDKTAFSVVPLSHADDELAYWLTLSPQNRLRALEQIRQTLYGYTFDTARLPRIFEVAQRESS